MVGSCRCAVSPEPVLQAGSACTIKAPSKQTAVAESVSYAAGQRMLKQCRCECGAAVSKSGAPLAVRLAHGVVGHAAGSKSKGLIKQQHGEGMPVCQHHLVVLDPVGDLHQEASRAQAGTQLPHCTSWPQQQLPTAACQTCSLTSSVQGS